MQKRNEWFTKELKILCIIAVVGSILLGLGTGYYKQRQTQSELGQAQSELLVRPDSMSLGNPSARVTLVEFFDPECESCRAFAPMVKQILREYPDRVRLVVRYMTFHFNSVNAVLATEAAGRQGKYWEMHDALFEKQLEWGEKSESKKSEIASYAKALGLDMDRYNRDIEDSTILQKIERDRMDGQRLGVRGTPTFFVNGVMVRQLGYDQLTAAIDAAN